MLALLLVMVTAANAGQAFIEHYNVSRLDMKSGMPANYVDDMLQDSNGFVWICNYGGGLLRYDGYSFLQPAAYGSLSMIGSFSCRNVCEDRFKRLWAAFDEGIKIINLNTRQRTDLTYKGKSLSKILNQTAVRVYCDSKGCIWVATRARIYYIRFNEKGDVADMIARPYSGNLPDMVVKDIDKDGSVWIAIDQGLFRLRPQNGRLVKSQLNPAFKEVSQTFITDIITFAGCTWFATNNGLYSYDNANGSMRHITDRQSSGGGALSHSFVSSLCPIGRSTLLVGTLHGVNIFDVGSNTVKLFNVGEFSSAFNNSFVNCITIIDDQIWVGTETDGIYKLTPRKLDLKQYTHNNIAGSISSGCVNAIYVEPDGTLWVGTVDGGLNRKGRGENAFTHLNTQNSALSHNSVSALMADGSRRLWVGTWGGGINLVSLDSPGTVTRLTGCGNLESGIDFIGALEYDKTNNGVWIGANKGLYFYNLKLNRIEKPFKGCEAVRGCVGSIIERNGTLWMGCLEGVMEIDLKENVRTDANGYHTFICKRHKFKLDAPKSGVIDKLSCFLQTADGTLWLGSNLYGLYRRATGKDGEIKTTAYTMQDGLANNSVKGLVEDDNGMIWIATNNGLSRLNPKAGVFTNYTVDDGLICNQFYWNGAVRSASGTLYFGTNKGLIEINGYDLLTGKRSANLRFTRLSIDNQEITADGKHLDQDVSTARRIRMNEWNTSIEISFSALNYYHERTGTYSYRLKGLEDEWRQLPPGQHSVRFVNLPAGSFTFEVRYSLDGINVFPVTALIEIDVKPYFYKSPAVVLLTIILIAAIAVYLYRKHIAKLRRHEADILFDPIRKTLADTEDADTLRQRIQNILDTQNRYKNSYEKTAHYNEMSAQKSMTFMDKVMMILEKEYTSSEFGATEMAERMGMSRVLLARKLKAETGLPPTKFINNYRLSIARKLIEKGTANRNTAEIAFSVGFNDPKYFARCFTREYGVSPSAYRRKEKDDSGNGSRNRPSKNLEP